MSDEKMKPKHVGKNFAELQAKFREQFPNAGKPRLLVAPQSRQRTGKGCISCLHKSVKVVTKFANELKAKQPKLADKMTAVISLANDLAAILPAIEGVGTEAAELIELFGVKSTDALPSGCGGRCNPMIEKMNEWGVAGCREHLDEIVAHLDSQKKSMSWKATAIAYARGAGLALTCSWFDPADPSRSIAMEAIRRTEAKEAADTAES